MQLQFLRTLKIQTAVRNRLGELPRDLREIYDEIYNSRLISDIEEQGSIAENTFKLVLSLQTPLGHRDFLHALSFCGDDKIDLSAEELLDLCCNFLVLDTELDVFRFAHLSVREYLETKPQYSSERGHALAAQFCLKYLCTSNASGSFLVPRDAWSDNSANVEGVDHSSIGSMSDGRVMSCRVGFPSLEDKYHLSGPSLDYPFLDPVQEYACGYWADHAAGSRHLRLVHPLSTMLRGFIMDTPEVTSPWFMYWNRLVVYMLNYSRRGICMPVWHYGHNKIDYMIHVPADYLFTASLWGFYDLLELRLKSKPDPLRIRSHMMNYNVLQLVCSHGNRDVVEFLLDRGWPLEVKDDYPLLAAAILGSQNSQPWPSRDIDRQYIEIAELLLRRGVDPEEKCRGLHGTVSYPILEALEIESKELVKLLLDWGASADVENIMGLKTFQAAAMKDNEEIVDMLLAASTDADDFPRSFCREVALIYQALNNNNEALLNSTLQQWPQDARGKKYLNDALWCATSTAQEGCMKALLAKGADPNFRFEGVSIFDSIFYYRNNGEHRMVSESWFSVAQLLLDHGADPGKTKYMVGYRD